LLELKTAEDDDDDDDDDDVDDIGGRAPIHAVTDPEHENVYINSTEWGSFFVSIIKLDIKTG